MNTPEDVINYEGFFITARPIKKEGLLVLSRIINSVNNSSSRTVLTNVKPGEILIDRGRIDSIAGLITDIRVYLGVVDVKVFQKKREVKVLEGR